MKKVRCKVATYKNGYLPSSALAVVQGTHKARTYVARQFKALNAAYRRWLKNTGRKVRDLRVNSGYRTYAVQKKLYNDYLKGKGALAAAPGYSNHGAGTALDINMAGDDSPAKEFMNKYGKDFGFIQDVPSEVWHRTYSVTPKIVDTKGRRRLYKGLKHKDVKLLQQAYNILVKLKVISGKTILEDGDFGPATEGAAKALNKWGGHTDSPTVIDKDYKWNTIDKALALKPAPAPVPAPETPVAPEESAPPAVPEPEEPNEPEDEPGEEEDEPLEEEDVVLAPSDPFPGDGVVEMPSKLEALWNLTLFILQWILGLLPKASSPVQNEKEV